MSPIFGDITTSDLSWIYRGSIEIWIDPTKRTKNDRNKIRFADARPEGHPTENPRDPWIYIDSIKRRQREMETNKIKIGKVWGTRGTGEDAHTTEVPTVPTSPSISACKPCF